MGGPRKAGLVFGGNISVSSILALILAPVTKSTYAVFFKRILFFLIMHFEQPCQSTKQIAINRNPHFLHCPTSLGLKNLHFFNGSLGVGNVVPPKTLQNIPTALKIRGTGSDGHLTADSQGMVMVHGPKNPTTGLCGFCW